MPVLRESSLPCGLLPNDNLQKRRGLCEVTVISWMRDQRYHRAAILHRRRH